MATTALGIMQDSSGAGVSPLTHRRIIKAKWANKGVVTGLTVSGRSDLTYSVAAGMAVVSRSDSDGYAEAYWEGGQTPAVSAGNSSNPRIDTIWLKAYDLQQGDPDNRVHVGVTQGTPGSNPVAPSAPSGCLAIARMRVPAGATSTASAQLTSQREYAIPYGATLGRLAYNVRNYEGPSNYTDDGKDYYENSVQFTVPTDRIVEFRFTACACACKSGDITQPTLEPLDTACWYVGVQLDGKDVPGGGAQFQLFRAWEPVALSVITTVTRGTHTARTRNHRVPWGNNVYFVAHTDSTQTYQGRTLEVWDRGVAQ